MRPLILLGMHRSGTSLTTRLLADIGIHMGSWLSRDAESVHFQRLNRRIFNSVGVRWGEVDLLIEAMNSPEFVEQQARIAQQALWRKWRFYDRNPVIVNFFGPQLWQQMSQDDSVAWGWKDPRTTVTFPIWTQVFPNARWLHVLRNGIDVTISTHRRSLKQQRKLRNRVFPIDYSPRTLDFAHSFHLWETYVSFVLERRELIPPGQYLEMRYEDLLAEPRRELQRVVDFVNYPVREEVLTAACMRIDKGRLDNSAFAADYRDVIPDLAFSPLMQRLGYDYSLAKE
jgi:hypothetical protein